MKLILSEDELAAALTNYATVPGHRVKEVKISKYSDDFATITLEPIPTAAPREQLEPSRLAPIELTEPAPELAAPHVAPARSAGAARDLAKLEDPPQG